jgi:uncharacterized protein (TIGR03067 family)
MKRFVAIVAVLLAVSATRGQDDVAKKDLKAMEGTWAVTVHEVSGMKISEEDNKKADAKLIVKDGKYTVFFGGMQIATGTIKLDTSKKPKQLDAIAEDGPTKGMAMPGIYQIEGETMKVCFAQPGKDRPTEFTTKEGSGQMLLSYKRAKN